MSTEPYGLLDYSDIDIYIRSLGSHSVCIRIRNCFEAMEYFLNGITVSKDINDGTIDLLMTETGIRTYTKAKVLMNKALGGKDISESDLPEGYTLAEFVKYVESITSDVYLTKEGHQLSYFQKLFVHKYKESIHSLRKGKRRGFDLIYRKIELAEKQKTNSPYLMGRTIESIKSYPDPTSVIDVRRLKEGKDSRRLMYYNDISEFKELIEGSSGDSNNDIMELASKMPALKHKISLGASVNEIAKSYLVEKISKKDYRYFNELLGTNLSEEEMHLEFMDLLDKGFVGVNLCTALLTKELILHGANYEKTSYNYEGLQENTNIDFILNVIYPLLEYELGR